MSVHQVSSARPTTLPSTIPVLVIDTIKPAEEPIVDPPTSVAFAVASMATDGSHRHIISGVKADLAPLVVRLYEPHGSRGTARSEDGSCQRMLPYI